MPGITCSVASCGHNDSGRCAMQSIHVFGRRATQPQSTGCESFENKAGGGSFTNVMNGGAFSDAAGGSTEIGCDARACTHNCAGRCNAGAIDMGGAYASTRGETECDSFRSGGSAE